MNKYGVVAIMAVELIHERKALEPLAAWQQAAIEIFGEDSWAHKKPCPKNAFLGLCEEGVIQGIVRGKYAARNGDQKNKQYALQAIHILRVKPEMMDNKMELWEKVMNGNQMSHNSQMDVVIALWKNKLLMIE